MTKREEQDARRVKAIAENRNRRLMGWLLLAILLAGTAFSVYLSNKPGEPLASAEVIALGAQVYSQNCASCHGDQGQGHAFVEQAPALDNSEHAWHHPDGQIQDLIINGGNMMPVFGDKLGDEEIKAVLRYFQTWWTAEQLAAQQKASQSNPFR
ncbi:MAG: cytochrome c [Anaerolineales bacterium]